MRGFAPRFARRKTKYIESSELSGLKPRTYLKSKGNNEKQRQRLKADSSAALRNDKQKIGMTSKKIGMTSKKSGGGVVAARARLDVADVYVFPLEGGGVVFEGGFGGFEELFVVAFGEVGFVVGSAGLVAEAGALDDDAA